MVGDTLLSKQFVRVALLCGLIAASPLLVFGQSISTSGDPSQAVSRSELVAARRHSMATIDLLMSALVTSATNSGQANPSEVQLYGNALSSLMESFPALFPPETNPGNDDADIEGVDTDAAAAIWSDFVTFKAFANTAAGEAELLTTLKDNSELTAQIEALQATCSGCHSQFLNYAPPSLESPGDLEFLDALPF